MLKNTENNGMEKNGLVTPTPDQYMWIEQSRWYVLLTR